MIFSLTDARFSERLFQCGNNFWTGDSVDEQPVLLLKSSDHGTCPAPDVTVDQERRSGYFELI